MILRFGHDYKNIKSDKDLPIKFVSNNQVIINNKTSNYKRKLY